jgi:hypothetical protein
MFSTKNKSGKSIAETRVIFPEDQNSAREKIAVAFPIAQPGTNK